MPEFLEGVTDIRLELPVAPMAFQALVDSMERPDTDRVVHTVTVSGHRVAGTYVAVGAREDMDASGRPRHTITLARLED